MDRMRGDVSVVNEGTEIRIRMFMGEVSEKGRDIEVGNEERKGTPLRATV